MKTKPLTKLQKVQSRFDELYGNGDFYTLGEFFWKGFLLTTGKERKLYTKLYDQLTREEQNWCE